MNAESIISNVAQGMVALLIIMTVAIILVAILSIIGQWKMFKKAGKPGYESIIPIYSLWVLIDIAKMHWVHFWIAIAVAALTGVNNAILSTIGDIAVYLYLTIINIKISKAFGKSTAFCVLAVLFPFIVPIVLGFGKSNYQA